MAERAEVGSRFFIGIGGVTPRADMAENEGIKEWAAQTCLENFVKV